MSCGNEQMRSDGVYAPNWFCKLLRRSSVSALWKARFNTGQFFIGHYNGSAALISVTFVRRQGIHSFLTA